MQENSDGDLLGEGCDPFPNDPDNTQAQCEADLAETLADLDQCLNPPTPTTQCSDGIDNDGDGQIDLEDRQRRTRQNRRANPAR
jgi:hypothetical protein